MPAAKSFGPGSTRILLLDDDPLVLSAIQEQLQPEGYGLVTSQDPSAALALLERESFSILIFGEEMPRSSGLELFAKIKDTHPDPVRILLTSTLSLKELFDSIKSGLIHRYVCKPWLREEFLAILRNTVATQLHLADASPASAAPAQVSAAEPAAAASGTSDPFDPDTAIEVFVKMLGTFHPNLGNTASRAMALCRTVADCLKLPEDQRLALVWAAGLHDIALVGVDRPVIRRWIRSPDRCSDEEMALIKKHPVEAQQMLEPYPAFHEAAEIVRHHHENWDGTGYPDRLKGEMIPWLSRVLSVAIFFSSRHQPPAAILAEIQPLAQFIFDPAAIEVVSKALPLTQMPRGEREILLTELQPGMVLARDIYNTSGVMIIAKGRELTTAWINKIHNINNTTPLNPITLIYC